MWSIALFGLALFILGYFAGRVHAKRTTIAAVEAPVEEEEQPAISLTSLRLEKENNVEQWREQLKSFEEVWEGPKRELAKLEHNGTTEALYYP